MSNKKKPGHIIKWIILALTVVVIVIDGIIMVPFIFECITEYGLQSLDVFELLLSAGAFAITIAEMVRLKKGRRFVLLPMIGMGAEAFLFAGMVSFLYEDLYLRQPNARAPWVMCLVLFGIFLLAALGIWALAGRKKKPKENIPYSGNLRVKLDEEYLLENPCECLITLSEEVYSEAFKQEFEIQVEPVEYPFQTKMDEYVERCKKHLAAFPIELIAKISDRFLEEWGEEWLEQVGLLSEGTTREKAEAFLKNISSGSIIIERPRGEEIAYSLGFEATFEEEHGISIGIRDNEVVYLAYRADQESPWTY